MAHCIGSVSVFCALLSGKLIGKVRHIVASQLAFTPGTRNLKAKVHFTGLLSDGFGVKYAVTYTDTEAEWKGKLFNVLSKAWSKLTVPSSEACSSHVCHRYVVVPVNGIPCLPNLYTVMI